MSIKVKDLAKEMKIASGALKSYLKIVGVEVKNHLSEVSDEDAQKVKQFVQQKVTKIQDAQRKTKKIHQGRSPRTGQAAGSGGGASDSRGGRSDQKKSYGQWSSMGKLDKPKTPSGGGYAGRTSDAKKSVSVSDDVYKSKAKKKRVFKDTKDSGGANYNKSKKRKKDEDIAKSVKQVLVGPAKKKKYKKEAKKVDGEITKIIVSEFTSVSELSKLMDIDPTEIVSYLFKQGQMATINQRLDKDTLEFICSEFNFEVEFEEEYGAEIIEQETAIESADAPLENRPPIVTVMGHVDHGKTSILDYIRKTKVTAGESGGITQHIGAYQVTSSKGVITFLDTPGHEAFTAMRARGANVTDVVIIVVAANDGVKPQTVEAIDHAKAAGVEIVVAINKMDLPGANIDKTIGDLAAQSLYLEGYGGNVVWAKCSAKTGEGIDELLDSVALVSQMKELKAKVDCNAKGVVIEAQKDQQVGTKTTVLVQEGTLNKGDIIVCGSTHGRVRKMVDETGKQIMQLKPSGVAVIYGLKEVSKAGDVLNKMDSEKFAYQIAQERFNIRKKQKGFMTHTNMGNLFKRIDQENLHKINLLIKADSDGSIEALKDSFQKLSTDEVEVKIIHAAVGGVLETDVSLAAASDAIIVGFHVRTSNAAKVLADNESVQIRLYTVIYDAIDDLKDAMSGLLSPEVIEIAGGMARLKKVFKIKGVGTIAGCVVEKGVIRSDALVRLYRDNIQVYEGSLSSLKHYKEEVKEVKSGTDCGLSIEGFNDLKEGDVIETFSKEEKERRIQ